VLHYVPRHRVPAVPEFVIGVLVLIGPWLVWTGGHSLSGPYAFAWNTVGAVLIVDSVRHSGTLVSRALGSRPMRVLGAHSYSLYLVHVPVILAVWYTFGMPITPAQTWKLIAWSVLDIAILTALFYRYVERPCLAWIASYKVKHAPN